MFPPARLVKPLSFGQNQTFALSYAHSQLYWSRTLL